MTYEAAKIFDLFNRLLGKFLGLTPAINLTIFFHKVNGCVMVNELPQTIIPLFIMELK